MIDSIQGRRQRYVVMCQGGNFRSTTCAYVLKSRGGEAVAIGHSHADVPLRDLLYNWADHIIIVEEHMRQFVNPHHFHKLLVWDVGPDRWCSMGHPELMAIFQKFADDTGWR